MPHVIRQCTKFAQASSEGRPIFLADRDSKGAQDIQTILRFIIATLAKKSPSKSPAPERRK
jgi:chromosome partitioning protein